MTRLTKKDTRENTLVPYSPKDLSIEGTAKIIGRLGKVEDIMEEYEIEDTTQLNKELNFLRILREYPNYTIGDLYNMVTDYLDGKINKEFEFDDVKFLCHYFKLNW